MRIGLDLDGTVVVYNDVFHRHAVEMFGLPAAVPARKEAVRDWLRQNAPGEEGWIELQGLVYGPRMTEASIAPGLPDFLRECRRLGIELSIVSHKTRLSVAKPSIDLHAAALEWLHRNGFFVAEEFGFRPEEVFFEPTRDAKIRRLIAEECVLFVDDLEEVFAEPAFPSWVERWLYVPGAPGRTSGGVRVFSDWAVLASRARELQQESDAAR
jgi:hypothetical protein